MKHRQRTQLIVATHADRLVRFLKPSEVVAINVNDEGAGEMVRAAELDLEKWLEDYTSGRGMADGPHRSAAMRIAILVEGKTEAAFKPYLLAFLKTRLAGKMPKLDIVPQTAGIPTGDKLKRVSKPFERQQATRRCGYRFDGRLYRLQATSISHCERCKKKMRKWVGPKKNDFTRMSLFMISKRGYFPIGGNPEYQGSNRKSPGVYPEKVNDNNPPAYRLAEIFRTGKED